VAKSVPCPTCAKPVHWSEESPWRPFCSERCRLIDLGEWFGEGHRIPIGPEDESPEEHDEDRGHH
jgi:endogenous inhibitor of DNA gyrase (YacG/DUF329 family)